MSRKLSIARRLGLLLPAVMNYLERSRSVELRTGVPTLPDLSDLIYNACYVRDAKKNPAASHLILIA